MILYYNSAIRHLIIPLIKKGYNVKLVGSLNGKNKCSKKDIDILINLPEYPNSDIIFNEFEIELKKLGWIYDFSDDNIDFGLFHHYRKRNKIGLDVWIREGLK